MKCDFKVLAAEAIASLSEQEREACVVYLEQRVIPAGELVPWAGISQTFDEPVVIAFIDLQPMLNWTHRARYVVIGARGGIQRKIDVDQPPFLAGSSPDLRLIHQGSRAPAWTIIVPT